jgi:hypothetical protein
VFFNDLHILQTIDRLEEARRRIAHLSSAIDSFKK